MRRSRVILSVALLALLTTTAATAATRSSQAVVPAYDLSGTWTSPLPADHGGTRMKLHQEGAEISWTGGPNDRAWIQVFSGRLHGAAFAGDFEQDEPGVSPPRYHGTMTATVLDSCRFRFTSIVQKGQPTLRNIVFTKEHCSLGRYRFGFRISRADVGLSVGSSGSFETSTQPNAYGDAVVSAVRARDFAFEVKTSKGMARVAFHFVGSGSYDSGSRVLRLELTVPPAEDTPCRNGSRDAELEIRADGVGITVCHLSFDYPAPKHASGWVKQS